MALLTRLSVSLHKPSFHLSSCCQWNSPVSNLSKIGITSWKSIHSLSRSTLFTADKATFSKMSFRNIHKMYCQNSSFRQKVFLNVKPSLQCRRAALQKVPCRMFGFATKSASKDGKLLKSDVKRLFAMAKPERARLAAAVALLIVSSSVTMAVPFAIGKIINLLNEGVSEDMVQRLWDISWMLLGVFLVGAVANGARSYLMQTSALRIINSMRQQLFSAITRQEIAFFDKTKTGELISRLSTDTTLVGQALTTNISDGLRSLAMAIASLSMMVYVSPSLTLTALSIVPPIAGVAIVYGRYVREITSKAQQALAESSQVAEERLANIRTVRAFAQELTECQRYNDRIDKVLNISYKEATASAFYWAFTGLSGNLIVLSVFYSGGVMMSESMLTVGDLTSFLLYAAYTGISIGGISGFFSQTMKGLGACSRVWELSDRTPTIPVSGGLRPTHIEHGEVEFRDLSFSYPTRPEMPIFTDLNLKIAAGQVLAVAGSSGCGKSTLAALLLRYYDPSRGTIFLDGMDIVELDPSWLRTHIGVVSQEPLLFSTTIAENIAYGAARAEDVSFEDIQEAARMANAHNFISSFPDQYETLVGERGVMLSGGQKQRIAIARAILKNPKILILDEATSALDAESEYLVQEALLRVMHGRTVLSIAHRLSTLQAAQSVAVLDAGRVAEIAPFDDLMSIEDGTFRKLVQRQQQT